MTRDVQLSEPAAELLRVARAVTQRWMRRIILEAAENCDLTTVTADLDMFVLAETSPLLDALETLLATDVDDQRTTPLSLYRDAVAAPNALLRQAAVPPGARDPFAVEAFPRDEYGLGPTTWADIDPSMHEPGLTWGAWKAMTVLRRRRDEGLR